MIPFLDELRAIGYVSFTTGQAIQALEGNAVAVRATLRRAAQKGRIATPRRGFHLIVPPEDRPEGCLPAAHFVPLLMEHLGSPYYAGLLTAAEYHGAGHQRPQVFQVMVASSQRRVTCGRLVVDYHTRRNLLDVPVIELGTPSGELRVSSPEATALDLVGYERWSAGLDHVATVLVELGEELDGQKLVPVSRLSPVSWAQRLGYLLETFGPDIDLGPLELEVQKRARDVVPLHTKRSRTGWERNHRWMVAVNVDLEPDL